MNELKVTQTLGTIAFNFDELKAEVQNMANQYSSLVYTDDVIGEAKEDRAKLNKLKTALNDERKRREKEFNEPFQEFKKQINDLIGIIEQPISVIDEQIKGYEAEKKAQKRAEIEAFFDSCVKPEFLDLSQIWNEKWLNATVTMKQVTSEIELKLAAIKTEMDTLTKMPFFAFEAMEEYKRTLDITQAIAEGQRLSDIQKRKEEAERLKAEETKTDQENVGKLEVPWLNEVMKEAQDMAKSDLPFFEEADEDYVPTFDTKIKAMVEIPENKLSFIGKWLEDNGCIVQIM